MSALTELEMRALTTKDVGRPLMDGEGLVGKVRQTRDGLTVYFEYRYRGTEGRQRAISCGAWPKLSLKKIRLARDAYRSKVGDGKDPLAEKEANKLTAHADQVEAVARDMARLDAVAAAAQRMTAIDLFDRWEKSALKARKDGGAEVRRMFEKDVLPELGAMAVEDIKKRHIAAMLDKIKERGVGRMVNLLLSLTRQMFRFAVSRDWIEADPTAALRKADFGGKEVERERVLSESEIKELRDKMPGGRFAPTTEAAIWIMLSTCCRVGELSKAEWCDLDIDGRRWRIPPGNAKNGRENVVTLSDFAAKHFEALRTLQTSRRWIFADRTGDQHIDDKTIAKQVRDRQRSAPMKGRSSKVATMLLAGGEWTPHDLRRTGATIMGELGIDGDVIERCLNHVEPNRIKRTYQRQQTEGAKAAAWRLLGERLDLLTRKDADNVVAITKRKAKKAA